MATQCRGTKTKRINRHKLAVIQAYIIIGTLVLIGFIGGLVVGRATAPKKQVTVTETVEVPSYEADSLPVAEEVTYFDVPLSHSLQRYIYEVCADEKAKGGYLVKGIAPAGAFNINNSCVIVATALKEFFVNGTPVEDTINSCDDIFQFQIIAKAGAKYREAYHTTFEISPSGNIAGTIFSPCRQHLATLSPRRLSVNAGRSLLKRSHRMTKTRQTSFKELWVIPCWV